MKVLLDTLYKKRTLVGTFCFVQQSDTWLTCLRPGVVIADCADNELNNEWILWITLCVVMSSRHHCSRLDPPRLGGDQTFIFIFISPVLGNGRKLIEIN